MAEILLLPFNGQLNLRNAYDWNRSQIYNFLQDVVNNPVKYNVLWNRVTELADIREHLLRLSLANGADFRAGPNLRPDQHIYRAANRAWIPQRPERPRGGDRLPLPPQPPATISKFTVRQHLHNDRGYWSPYDLLGLFLSIIGPAPDGATKRNFYLPMTAVYGRWCRQIAGRDYGGIGDLPSMFQCTWRTGPPTWFSLGSSLAGYNWKPNLTGTWQTVLKRARFDLVDPVPLLQHGYNFDNSPMIEAHGEATKFGNCAETYPFADLLVGHNHNKETCHGLALQRDYVNIDGYQDMRSGVTWGNLRNPCRNCSMLIAWYDGDIKNFRPDTESAGAPP